MPLTAERDFLDHSRLETVQHLPSSVNSGGVATTRMTRLMLLFLSIREKEWQAEELPT